METASNLERFITAQSRIYEQALAEINAGRKRSHWMWFIFPQLRGLGHSHNASFYGIADLAEAASYLQHPALGPRLIGISRALLALPDSNATKVMGSPDDQKLQSCMTLFSLVPATDPVFAQVLTKFYHGLEDSRTIDLLNRTDTL